MPDNFLIGKIDIQININLYPNLKLNPQLNLNLNSEVNLEVDLIARYLDRLNQYGHSDDSRIEFG